MAASLVSVGAQTNEADSGKSEYGSYEVTLGGYGTSVDGENQVGLDFSVSTNPLEQAPNVWVGVVQGVYWEPTFSASTDLNVNYSWHVYKELYLNTGWSGGALYTTKTIDAWRSGPEATFQYYVGDSAFLYTGVNYDVFLTEGKKGFRYSFGVGLTF